MDTVVVPASKDWIDHEGAVYGFETMIWGKKSKVTFDLEAYLMEMTEEEKQVLVAELSRVLNLLNKKKSFLTELALKNGLNEKLRYERKLFRQVPIISDHEQYLDAVMPDPYDGAYLVFDEAQRFDHGDIFIQANKEALTVTNLHFKLTKELDFSYHGHFDLRS
ncbi:hypothetical protein [Enterococcus larvae]|uniref:hypothetical protein n=1 Tax=Enterococcus larvae TaxID=2794352 RepID=UPI003F343F1B